MNFMVVFVWAAVAMVLGWLKLISLNTLFLGFSIIMAAEYLSWGQKE